MRTICAAERLRGWSVTRCRIEREINRDEKQMAIESTLKIEREIEGQNEGQTEGGGRGGGGGGGGGHVYYYTDRVVFDFPRGYPSPTPTSQLLSITC